MRLITAVLILAFVAVPPLFLSAGELPTIKVGHVGHDHQIALYVAAEAGRNLEKTYGVYFERLKDMEVYVLHDNGLPVATVHMVRVGGGSKMPAALEQGHIEMGLGGLGPVAKFVDKGSAMKVLAPLNNDGDALVLAKDFPAGNWEEFVDAVKKSEKPVKIGYKAPMAVAYMILTHALKHEGISFGQEPVGPDGKPVEIITVNLQDLGNALPSLESGIVDGVVVNEPMVSILTHKGVGRRVADLSDLPPSGKWKGHPCCIVAATDKAIEEKRAIIKSMLKAIAVGADLMAADPSKALEAETKWTRTDPEVAKTSIANVNYVIRPDNDWLKGVDTWIELMTDSGHFKADLKDKTPQEISGLLLDLGPVQEAIREIRLLSDSENLGDE